VSLSSKKLSRHSLQLLYFSRFILTTIPAQAALLLLYMRKPVLPVKFLFYILCVIFYWACIFSFGYSAIRFQHVLFYFSFIPPLVILSSQKQPDVPVFISDRFIIAIFALTILEAILVNSPIAEHLYFFSLPEDSSERVKFMGFYQRPLGIAGNASMTSCVLIFSVVLADTVKDILTGISSYEKCTSHASTREHTDNIFTYRTLLLIVSILILASGTGFVLLLLYLSFKLFSRFQLKLNSLLQLIGMVALLIVCIYGSIYLTTTIDDFDKFSMSYAELIYDYKIEIVRSNLEMQNANLISVLFGMQTETSLSEALTSGDFGYIVMYNAIGLFGSILVLIVPLLFISTITKFIIPTIFFYLSFVHYPGLLSPPGAVLFSLYIYLMLNYNHYDRHQHATDNITHYRLI